MEKAVEEEDEGEQDLVALMPIRASASPSTDSRCEAGNIHSKGGQTAGSTNALVTTTTENEPMSPLTTEVMVLRELELAPVVLHPQQISRATEIRLLLARIEFIAIHEVIVREEGVIYFVLGIYRYRQQKGLPSTRNSRRKLSASQPIASKKLSDREPTDRAPDYQIEQRYSSFARLRSNVAHIARKHHPKCKTCAYCSGLLDFLHMTPCKPSLKVKFATTTEERKHILSAFINDLVYMVREGYASCPRSLRGYHIIPALVKRFLSEQTGESFFS